MQKYLAGLVALFFPLLAANAAENICFNQQSIPMMASTPTSQFNDITNDQNTLVVTDNKTGLMWMRCTRNFEWDEVTASCKNNLPVGDVTVNWITALEIVSGGTVTVGGHNDWRLPNVKELASIIERKCFGLTINNNIFPGSAAAKYWSNTHVLSSTSDVRVVDFSNGSVTTSSGTTPLYLRLVRDAN